MKNENKGEIVLYSAPDGSTKIDVKLRDETVWLTQVQMAELFNKDKSVISRHIKNVFDEGELERPSTVANFATVQKEGDRYIQRKIEFYNLDVIISVGYRVKSQRGTQCRIWASSVLKDYLVKGYSLNQERLKETRSKLEELKQTITFISENSKRALLSGQEKELLDLVSNYTSSLILLEQYDENKIPIIQGTRKESYSLSYDEIKSIISELKSNPEIVLGSKKLFGRESNNKLKGIVGAIYQTFDSEDLYPTNEDKAANIIYLIIKDHPFIDGNKRIASIVFIYYLEKNHLLYKKNGQRKINDSALVALSLLIASSKPNDKEILVNLIKNLIK